MSYTKHLNLKVLKKKSEIGVIGLGYVGLPVAYNFSLKHKVVGYDVNKTRVSELKRHYDRNGSILSKDLRKKSILFSSNIKDLKDTNIFIITTPTPIDKKFKPNLEYIIKALKVILKVGLRDKLIILESTVFPGASEEIFIRYLEKRSKLVLNKNFYFGYSPERINPGDKKKTFKNIAKIVSGSNKETSKIVYKLYKSVVENVFMASSIKHAETAKLIENTQRDLNIAFINEIAIACNRMNLSFSEVKKLASTKWNFLNFSPGLVGGHCISVDPYYLFHSLKKNKYNPLLLLSGRNLNEKFPEFLSKVFLDEIKIKKPKVLLLGATYKADCNDVRNSKSLLLYEILEKKGCKMSLYDPYVENSDLKNLKNFNFIKKPKKNFYNGIFVSVDHLKFKQIGYKGIKSFGNKDSKIFDLKNILKSKKDIIHL